MLVNDRARWSGIACPALDSVTASRNPFKGELHLVNKIWVLGILNRHTGTHTHIVMLILCVNVMECPVTWSHIILDLSVRALGVLGETGLQNSGLRKGGCPLQCRGLIQSAEDPNRTTLTFPQTRGNSSCRTAFEPGHPRFLPLDSNLNLNSSHILSLWPPDGNHTSSNLGSSWPSAGPQT